MIWYDETVRGIHGAKLNVLQYSRLRPIYCGGELSTITIDESFSIYSITPKLQSPQNSVKRWWTITTTKRRWKCRLNYAETKWLVGLLTIGLLDKYDWFRRAEMSLVCLKLDWITVNCWNLVTSLTLYCNWLLHLLQQIFKVFWVFSINVA